MSKRRRRAHIKIAFHYQTVLHELEQRFLEGQGTLDEILEQLDLFHEWDQIKKAQAWCAQHAEEDDGVAMLCNKFAGVAGTLLETRLSRLEQIEWIEAGLAAAERLNLVEDQGAHLTRLGFAHLMNNNLKRATLLLDRALILGQTHQYPKVEATALGHLGMVYLTQNKIEEAIRNLEAALVIHHTRNDHRAEGSTLGTLGSCYSNQGRYDKAIEYFDKTITLSREHEYLLEEGFALANKGGVLINVGDLDDALVCLDDAIIVGRKIRERKLVALVFVHHALLSMRIGDDSAKVIEQLKDALEMFRQEKDQRQVYMVLSILEQIFRPVLESPQPVTNEQRSYALRELAKIYLERQQFNEAQQLYRNLLAIAQEHGDPADELEALISMGHCSAHLRDYQNAVTCHEQALDVLAHLRRREGDPKLNQKAECELLLSLGQAYRHLSEPLKAEESYEKALTIAIAKERPYLDAQRRAYGNLGLIYTDLGRFEDAFQKLEKAHDMSKKTGDYQGRAHALFNLAYAHHRKGDDVTARQHGEQALHLLELINDPSATEVQRQMETWWLEQNAD